MEASGAEPEHRAARVHAFTSRRMMTRYDAWTNILRVTTAAFAAAIGGADEITTYPFTDALGPPTPFARRVARNTQHVLLEECRLGHVADPAGGAWFVERLTRELAAKAWDLMQAIEAKGGIVASLHSGHLQDLVADARATREKLIATRRETITGVTDFPLLDKKTPDIAAHPPLIGGREGKGGERAPPTGGALPARPLPLPPSPGAGVASLQPIRWAAPFEALRDRARGPRVFFATLGALADFGPRALFARNLFAAGGVGAIGEEKEYASRDAMVDAFRRSGARVAVICGTDALYAQEAAVNAAQRLKAAGADWVMLAGKPGEHEAKWRAAGVDQFVFAGQDALKELEALHAALGIRR
jgi:methylmalonyl-CoA mutase